MPSSVANLALSPAPRLTQSRVLGALLLMLAGAAATWGSWNDIKRVALSDEEASHVWLVPFLAGWLVWVRRDLAAKASVSGAWAGPLLVAAGWAISHWGFYHAKMSPFQFGGLLVVIGCAVSVLGLPVLGKLWPVLLVLAFIVPVPGMVRQQIAIPLEKVTAWATGGLLHLFGLPVTRSGNVLSVNAHDVTVAEACNGMRMVFPLFLICVVFAFSLPLRGGVRFLLLVTSPLSAVLCNVIRLVPTAILYGYAKPATAKSFHDISGWLMLPIAFLLLMGIIRVLKAMGVPVMVKAKREAIEPVSRSVAEPQIA